MILTYFTLRARSPWVLRSGTIQAYLRDRYGSGIPKLCPYPDLDTKQIFWIRATEKIVNLTEMSFKFEFFHLNLFVSGPVFNYLSNKLGLVRVCGYLCAVLFAAFGVGVFSSMTNFEF